MEEKLRNLVDKFTEQYSRLLGDLNTHAGEAATDGDNWDRVTDAFCEDLETLKTGFVRDALAACGGA